MDALSPSDKTPEEALVYWVIVATWPIYFCGLIYHTCPIIAWTLGIMAVRRRMEFSGDRLKPHRRLPAGVWVWFAGMLLMAVALVAGHFNYDLGVLATLKSLFGWAKGWALFAVLIFAGATLRIRQQVLARAMNVLFAQTLLITPLMYVAAMAHLPPVLYTSPMLYLGGAGDAFFQVGTHWIDPGANDVRLRYYAPWSPAAAFTAQCGMIIGLYDRDWRWRVVGIVGALVMCLMAKSRLSAVGLPMLMLMMPLLSNLYRPAVMGLGAVTSFVGAISFSSIVHMIEQGQARFNAARADSSRVRATLRSIAWHRWQSEAPLFGHGMVERGPHLVEFMPIGSHHTWYGLLFIKGAVGTAALALPMLWTLFEMIAKAQRDRAARTGVGIVLVMFLNSFGENLEILAYLVWPGLLMLGLATKRRQMGLWTEPLSGDGRAQHRRKGFVGQFVTAPA